MGLTPLPFFSSWLFPPSVMLDIFVSTFAPHEGQVFPFIPLVVLPSVFLSRLLVDMNLSSMRAEWLEHALPLLYANNVIQEVIQENGSSGDVWGNLVVLVRYGVVRLFVVFHMLPEVE